MVDCNVIENYLKEKTRMCKSYENCDDCPFDKFHGYHICGAAEAESLREAIRIVQKWSNEHPRKTIMDDFLEKYPNAKEHPNYGKDAPMVCAKELGYVKNCCLDTVGRPECDKCWQTLLDEVVQ